ncbi:MAG: hypothetical protein ABR510_09660 [Trueperaceae bacterium]
MISLSQIHPGAVRLHELQESTLAARLRRAGFKDQERTPRHPFYWANR